MTFVNFLEALLGLDLPVAFDEEARKQGLDSEDLNFLEMQYDAQDNDYNQNSHFLSTSSRKSPTRSNVKQRKSSSSLRAPADDDAANGRHSLAHELAVALMPEPSAGSRLLAEEFGIEYDEGAEGIDEDVHANGGVHIVVEDTNTPSFTAELTAASFGTINPTPDPDLVHTQSEYDDPVFGTPSASKIQRKEKPQQDAMEVLAQDLESTDKFLAHLRKLDIDPGSSGTQQPALERLASDVIRKINETTRDREGQVRELLEYEREFRKIAGEVGGSEVLGCLEELTSMDDLSEDKPSQSSRRESRHVLDVVEEESLRLRHPTRSESQDWEMDPDRLGDEEEEEEPVASPTKDSFPAPPPITGDLTPAKTIPQLAHLRSFTTSLVTSLATISEQAQVNGAATTEAGRKIRALKNKLGGWRTDWDSAERSRLRIARWEAGMIDSDDHDGIMSPPTPTYSIIKKRVDGRRVVEEHLHAFELALSDAAVKTQAIMAAS
ncbi:hypothetical protein H0H81_006472 [Sphagnurus paluster]|uniref:Uncharacterized protein n=1 Tax=Sphagnurus paluster TaxID=117069 RepID=A0A9P7GK09_9AGAR|nr:hypothetical protein H0H81_006472 [Sphagnurus paluster]